MKLSVCIVTYNHESLIGRCIESVLRQKVDFDYEIVVGEDCSTDGTRAILHELAARHPDKLKVMDRSKNLGAELNFNTTIAECQGEYIAFLEGDNTWTTDNKLQLQVDFLDQHPEAALCCHRVGYVDEDGNRMNIVLPPEDPLDLSDIRFLLQDSNPVGLGTVVARRLLLQGLADWVKGLKMGDWPLCLMLATRGKIGFIAQEMSLQRVHPGGTWQNLPAAVQIAYMIQMCNHVGPRLPMALQPAMGAMANRFLDQFCDQLMYGDQGPLPIIFEKLEALNDKALLNQIMRSVIEGERVRAQVKVTECNGVKVDKQKLERALADARKNPGQVVRDLLVFRITSYLARQPRFFSTRQREKLNRSAGKRDPNRGLLRFGKTPDLGQTSKRVGSEDAAGNKAYDPALQTILLISHDSDRTGAPILALNIAQNLATRYNVVSLVLRGGDLLDDFAATSIHVAMAQRFTFAGSAYLGLIQSLTKKYKFLFAIVNSMESRGVLLGLHQCQVPMLSLIHEFSSYSNPKTAAVDFFKLSDQTVFSSKITLENALQETNWAAAPGLHVIPQGKCAIPRPAIGAGASSDEIAWLTSMLRPIGGGGRDFVVLGAGTVNIRKGVDLFVEVATRVLNGPGGERFRFVWIGSGYDPDRDLGYSIYLRDQMRRAGIEDRMLLLQETSEIEAVYRLSDALLLSSRLDPLPNVAIDALSVGKPVFCFDRTTGIADILIENGLGADCVASYLDTTEMAAKIVALAQSDTLYADVCRRSKELADRTFDFAGYVDQLNAIALQAVEVSGKIRKVKGD